MFIIIINEQFLYQGDAYESKMYMLGYFDGKSLGIRGDFLY